jgi:hypothetical protein
MERRPNIATAPWPKKAWFRGNPAKLCVLCYAKPFQMIHPVANRFLRVAALLACFSTKASDFQGATHLVPIDEDSINYSKAQPDSAISKLQKQIDSNELRLEWDQKYGYLPSVLKALHVPVESQMLVFSKTSLQRERISPQNPRALYFNDDIYIGWIPGAPLMEVSVADPKLGGVFYSLEQKPADHPRFKRNDQCLECHASSKSMGVPGHLMRSFATDEDGVVDLSSGTSQVNDRTPFEERWGGWYVTGTHGNQTHRGNLVGKAAFERQEKEPNFAGNCANLANYFSIDKYQSPHSDIVALMVLEHQTHMHNYIARLNYEATLALKTYGHVNYLKSVLEGFVQYMLFAEEAPLTHAVKGTSDFQQEFASQGPKDCKGRSLRDFDLKTRLFAYPCSFLIYSESFDALPKPIKEKLYARLFDILSGKDQSETYQRLSPEIRRAIFEILRDTKRDLPANWKNDGAA